MSEPPTSDFRSDDLPAIPVSWFQEATRHRCELCGREAPTKVTTFNQHIGAVVVMFHREFRGRWCKDCIHKKFWSTTLVTLFFGWWGLISFFFTPVILIANVFRYVGALGLESPPRDGGQSDAPSPNQLLEPYTDDIVERVREKQSFGRLVREVADPVGVGRGPLAKFLLQLVMDGRLRMEESQAGDAPPPTAGLPPSGRPVGPGIALAVLGVVNLLWVALYLPVSYTVTETTEPPKGAPADAPHTKRPMTPEEIEEHHLLGWTSAVVNGPIGLMLLTGGVQSARRRWYPLAVASSVTAMVPCVTICCFAGLPVGIWSLMVLLNSDVRATFT